MQRIAAVHQQPRQAIASCSRKGLQRLGAAAHRATVPAEPEAPGIALVAVAPGLFHRAGMPPGPGESQAPRRAQKSADPTRCATRCRATPAPRVSIHCSTLAGSDPAAASARTRCSQHGAPGATHMAHTLPLPPRAEIHSCGATVALLPASCLATPSEQWRPFTSPPRPASPEAGEEPYFCVVSCPKLYTEVRDRRPIKRSAACGPRSARA